MKRLLIFLITFSTLAAADHGAYFDMLDSGGVTVRMYHDEDLGDSTHYYFDNGGVPNSGTGYMYGWVDGSGPGNNSYGNDAWEMYFNDGNAGDDLDLVVPWGDFSIADSFSTAPSGNWAISGGEAGVVTNPALGGSVGGLWAVIEPELIYAEGSFVEWMLIVAAMALLVFAAILGHKIIVIAFKRFIA